MKILLVGEYSRLHNSLKEGLTALGHSVTIVGTGDNFKKYSVDLSYHPALVLANRFTIGLNKLFYRLFKTDLQLLEKGLRFYFLLPKLKGYDHVQLINSDAIETYPALSRLLYNKLLKQNGTMNLLVCGEETPIIDYLMTGKMRYSILSPLLADASLKPNYQYSLKYTSATYRKLFEWVKDRTNVIITSDLDYTLPMRDMGYAVTHIPNPVNIDVLQMQQPQNSGKVVIFLGINRLSQIKKGTAYFEDALHLINEKYQDRIEVIIAENMPYDEYIQQYNKAHIVLDQALSYDQGYNALEAMAKGKVVFTGAEQEFMDFYGLDNRVAVNALPDAVKIADELSHLIDNPEEIAAIATRARTFIEREHNYIAIAEKYVEAWRVKKVSS